MKPSNSNELCPCQSQKRYAQCCQKLHLGELAIKPEELMRSRYSAFVFHLADYLIKTTHTSCRSHRDQIELEATFKANQYSFLKIVQSKSTECEGFVEFVAVYQDKNGYQQLHEYSKFLKENNAWVYHSGKILAQIKWGRNDPCFCGSGKKSKKCHPQNPF